MIKAFLDRTLLKFILVGIINTLAGMAIMFGLYNLAGASYWISTAANYVLVSILSFILNRKFTFRYKGALAGSGLRFAINIAVCYFLAYGISKSGTAIILMGFSRQVQENVAMLAGMGLFVLMNYMGQRLFVFPCGNAPDYLGELRIQIARVRNRVLLEAREDDEDPGTVYDQEAVRQQMQELIERAKCYAIPTEPSEETKRLIREKEERDAREAAMRKEEGGNGD